MGKYYLHPSGELADGKIICSYCKREMPQDFKTDFPCTVSVKPPFDDEVEVNVWNCQARVVVSGKFVDFEGLPSQQGNKLARLAEESVYKAGWGINTSGIYPASDELCKYVSQLKRKNLLV